MLNIFYILSEKYDPPPLIGDMSPKRFFLRLTEEGETESKCRIKYNT